MNKIVKQHQIKCSIMNASSGIRYEEIVRFDDVVLRVNIRADALVGTVDKAIVYIWSQEHVTWRIVYKLQEDEIKSVEPERDLADMTEEERFAIFVEDRDELIRVAVAILFPGTTIQFGEAKN